MSSDSNRRPRSSSDLDQSGLRPRESLTDDNTKPPVIGIRSPLIAKNLPEQKKDFPSVLPQFEVLRAPSDPQLPSSDGSSNTKRGFSKTDSEPTAIINKKLDEPETEFSHAKRSTPKRSVPLRAPLLPEAVPPAEKVMYDPWPERIKKLFFILLLGSFISLSIVILTSSSLRSQLATTYNLFGQIVFDLLPSPIQIRFRNKATGNFLSKSKEFDSSIPPTTRGHTFQNSANADFPCFQTPKLNTKNQKQSLAENSRIAECFLAKGKFQDGFKIIDQYSRNLVKKTEKDFNRMTGDGDLADVFYIIKSSRYGKYLPHTSTENFCRSWTVSNTCVTKLAFLVNNGFQVPEEARSLFERKGKLGSKFLTRLWLAGAKIAETEGQPDLASKRFILALSALPKNAFLLKKEIYESFVLHLFLIGNRSESLRILDLVANDNFLHQNTFSPQLELVRTLINNKNNKKKVGRFLNQDSIHAIAFSDPRILDVLGVETLRLKMFFEFGKYLDQLNFFLDQENYDHPKLRRLISEWKMRLLLAQGSFNQALSKLRVDKKNDAIGATDFHLSAVAHILQSPSRRNQLEGSKDFQSAWKLDPNEESYIGLGFALLRAGETKESRRIVDELDSSEASGRSTFWIEMLKAELFVAENKITEAENILEKWLNMKPEYIRPKRLFLEVLRKKGNMLQASALEEELKDLENQITDKFSTEDLSAPIGPFALKSRSIYLSPD